MLVWIPAHTTPASVGEVKNSDGFRLSHIDWRANRLVDGLAKLAASERRAPEAVLKLLASGDAAVIHAASLLGQVTHASNNHRISVMGPDGDLVSRVCRDAEQRATRATCQIGIVRKPQPPRPPAALPASLRPWTPATHGSTGAPSVARAHGVATRALDAAHLKRRVDEIGAGLVASSSTDSAASRIARLSERVRSRGLLSQSTDSGSGCASAAQG